jgi:hypothetical protein
MDEAWKGDRGARDRHVDREQDEKTREQQPVRQGSALRAGAFFLLRLFDLVSMYPVLGDAEQNQRPRNGEQGRGNEEGGPDAGEVSADPTQSGPDPGGDEYYRLQGP